MGLASERKVKVIRLTNREISVYFENYRRSLINALRRIILSDVPTLAIDFVYFYDNRTAIPSEIIAHRLGLTVLDSNEAIKKYKSPEECRGADEKDSKCYVEIFLEKGLQEEAETGLYVRASDLIISDPAVKPVYPSTPLIYIAPGQRIHLVAYARLGRGKEHAKWMPASISVLRYVPVVEYDGSKATPQCLTCLSAYPELVNKLRKGEKGRMMLLDPNTKTSAMKYCEEARGVCEGAIRVFYDESKLLLTVESTGALKPETIVAEAINALEDRVKRVLDAISGAEW